MRYAIKLLILLCLFCIKSVSGQGLFPNSLSFNMPDLRGALIIPAVLCGGFLISAGNEIHIGLNYSNPYLIWDKSKDHNLKGGSGLNIELRHAFLDKHRVVWGFQRNHYTKILSNSTELAIQYDYYYLGYTHDIGNLKQGVWKPYLGSNFILSDKKLTVGLLVGSRLSFADICQLEGRITMSPKNINLQLGISVRYRKDTSVTQSILREE